MPALAPLVLVDGSSYLYRAFHAAPPLTNRQGQPTGAVKLVLNMLRRLIKDYPNSTVAVVFDAKGKTFRDDIYPEYKAHRPPMPDALRLQIEPVHTAITAMGLPLLCVEGVEADDVIGTLAQQATAAGQAVVISTGDKDMAQLVNPHVTLINTMTNTTLDEAGVLAKFGLPPSGIIDLLALMGDTADNIPGVPGIGEKTALTLLQTFGSLNQLYQQLEQVPSLALRGAKGIAAKLAEHQQKALLSYQLATIKTDCTLPLNLHQLHSQPANTQALRDLYQQLEFTPWLNELTPQDSPATPSPSPLAASLPCQFHTLTEWSDFEHWLNLLQTAPLFAIDTETTSLDYMDAKIVGLSFAITPEAAAYVPLHHDYLGAPKQLNAQAVLNALKPILENPNQRKIGQNIKYDAHVFANSGIQLQGMAYDTLIESWLLNSIGRHDLDSLSQEHLQHTPIAYTDIAGKGAKQLSFNQIAIEQAAPYAAEDAHLALRLHQHLWPRLTASEGLKTVYDTIECPLLPVIARLERQGALLDARAMAEHSQQLGHTLAQLEEQAYALAGQPFNLNSPKQLGEILFEKLQIPTKKKTATGQYSTAEEVLQELALDYPLPRLLLEHRSLAKLKSTYTDKLPQMINPATGRIHTRYNQCGAATGRLSSSDPNLQNIPIKTAEGRRIRQAFIAPKGYSLVAADYSQIELRIMAHLSQDAGLLNAFASGQDIHRATAAEVFNTPLAAVTSDQRRSAKAINFGLIYGMGAFGLARQLHISNSQAQSYIDLYFSRYPGVKAYMDTTRLNALEKGYVETLCGRRLNLPDIHSNDRARRQGAERVAINAPMQGTAADIIKLAMIAVDHWLEHSQHPARMILQVHDELVFEVPTEQVDTFIPEVIQRMSQVLALSVPLVVEAGHGLNWEQAH